MDRCTDGRTDGQTFETQFNRSTRLSRPNQTSNQTFYQLIYKVYTLHTKHQQEKPVSSVEPSCRCHCFGLISMLSGKLMPSTDRPVSNYTAKGHHHRVVIIIRSSSSPGHQYRVVNIIGSSSPRGHRHRYTITGTQSQVHHRMINQGSWKLEYKRY